MVAKEKPSQWKDGRLIVNVCKEQDCPNFGERLLGNYCNLCGSKLKEEIA